MLPSCNGVMTVHRDYTGETPCGMKFTTLAGVMGGGASSPGFVGHSKYNITQRKFIVGDGGLLRMVWMPKILKDEIKERLIKRGTEMGVPDLIDKIADETVGHHRRRDPALPAGKGASGPLHGADHRLMVNVHMHVAPVARCGFGAP
jgi:CO dehydrogenase/acetyl-CoA synthase beta subunit